MANLESKIFQKIEGMKKEVLYDIFVYIHKIYDVLDWGSALAIMEGCGVGTQDLQLLNQYWYWATMGVRVSGSYRYPFQGYQVSPREVRI